MTAFSQTAAAITIGGPAGALEARCQNGNTDGAFADRGLAAIVCHPHPQHGGSMNNKVVTTLMRVYRELGVPAVRFNFRGVGASEGEYDSAVGEVEDLMAVHAWLSQTLPKRRLLLAGFSFGSAVAAAASHRLADQVAQLTLVAPPVERYDYDRDGAFPCPVCVAQGERDEVVNAEGVFDWYEKHLNSPKRLLRYPETGHFFHGQLTPLREDLVAAIPAQLEAER